MEFELLVAAQTRYLGLVTAETKFSAALLRAMHGHWLRELYIWAGEYRVVDVSKEGFVWPRAALVPDLMQSFERGHLARHTPCRAESLEEVCNAIAEVHAELLLIHPFREGNGRLARWLADLMALQAGYPAPMYRFSGRGSAAESARYLDAVKAGYFGSRLPLAELFREMIERRM